jgi:DNA-binding IclR family transcriptional regulator
VQERQIQLLEIIATCGPVKVSELALRIKLPRATLYRSIASLVACGFIEEVPDGSSYVLGPRFMRIAMLGLSSANLMQVISIVVSRILDTYEETVFFARLRENRIEIAGVQTPTDQSQSYIYPGLGERPVHACSSAKAITAFMDAEARDDIYKDPFNQFTTKTIIDRKRLERELKAVRKNGFAVCNGEIEDGVLSMAVPIHLDGIGVRFCIGVVGPDARLSAKLDNGAHDFLIQQAAKASPLIVSNWLDNAASARSSAR